MAGQEGKGSLKHREYQNLLSGYFRSQGMVAVIEAYIGKNVDILVMDGNKTIGIEIQLSAKHYLQIERDLQFGCNEVWVVCESNNVLDNLRRKTREELSGPALDRTKFFLMRDFFPHNENNNNRITRNKMVE